VFAALASVTRLACGAWAENSGSCQLIQTSPGRRMSVCSRCQRAGGIPIHLQHWAKSSHHDGRCAATHSSPYRAQGVR